MENGKIKFYLNDKLNLYVVRISKSIRTNYNKKAPLTFFQCKRPHLEYSWLVLVKNKLGSQLIL